MPPTAQLFSTPVATPMTAREHTPATMPTAAVCVRSTKSPSQPGTILRPLSMSKGDDAAALPPPRRSYMRGARLLLGTAVAGSRMAAAASESEAIKMANSDDRSCCVAAPPWLDERFDRQPCSLRGDSVRRVRRQNPLKQLFAGRKNLFCNILR